MRLKHKTAVVTGGASGFGAGIAKKFVAEGARVWIADVNATAAAAFASETDVRYSVTDVGSNDSVQALVAAVCEEFGHIDIFINNAGIGHLPQRLEEIDEAEFDRVLNVNAKSVYLTSRHVVPVMKQSGGGVILNIASTAGISPRPGLTWYNASKGWLITATKSMAAELAKDNIRVNALAPVAGETPLLATFMGEDTPEIREKFLATIPLGRFSTPEDIGQAACFLCSDEASMITGVALEVDGGRCI